MKYNILDFYQTGENFANAKNVGDAEKSVTSHHPVKEGFVGLVDDEVEKVSIGGDD